MAVKTIYELGAVSYSLPPSLFPNGQSSLLGPYVFFSGTLPSRKSALRHRGCPSRLLRRSIAAGRNLLAFGRSTYRMGSSGWRCGCACSDGTERACSIRSQTIRLEACFSSGLSKLIVCQSCVRSNASRNRASRSAIPSGLRASWNRTLLRRREGVRAYSSRRASTSAQLGKTTRSLLV